MAVAFLPSDYDDLEQCRHDYTLNWIYNNKCSEIVSTESCQEVTDVRSAQITALGAIIHVVQDSYSPSHTKRGQCAAASGKEPASKISCLPIAQFYTYNVQDASKHNASDVLPIAVDASCRITGDKPGGVDDAVTATATVLWHAAHGKTADELIAYLERAVFRNPYQHEQQDALLPTAGAGDCYKQTSPQQAPPAINRNDAEFRERLMGR